MLSTGLLIGIGGGAIAAADTDPSASPTGTQGADASNDGTSPASGGTDRPTTEAEAGAGDTGTAGSLPASIQGQTGLLGDPTTEPLSTEGEYAEQWVDPAASESAGEEAPIAPGSGVPATDPTVVVSDSSVPASDSSVPASSLAASSSNVVAPGTDPVAPFVNAVQPVANAVTTIANVVGSVPARVEALQTSATPVSDFVTSVSDMLATVAGAMIPLAQVPSDIYSLLGIPRPAQPLIGAGGTSVTFVVDDAAPLFGAHASQSPQVPAGDWGRPLFGNMTPLPTLGTFATTSVYQSLSVSGTVPLAPEGASPAGARSLLEHVVSAVLVPASLTALAALALPGVGGLLVICAAGIRVGYRQAKAGWALRVSGIARFAGPGPLGVVRSGSLIALHSRAPRASRVVRPEMAPVTRHLERVA